jgi:hypothetical protein
VIAQITLDSVANPLPQDGMLLLLSGVAPTPAYAYDAVSVYYSDPGDVPSMPISPLIRAERLTSQGVTNRYLGLYFADLNTPTLTVRLEIDAMVGQTAPSIMLTAAYLSTPIPEPSTALMVGLGLIGLAVQRRR